MGADAAEILPDVFAVAVVNFSNEPNTLLQLRKTRPIGFGDIAVSTGLAGLTRTPMKFGAMFLDADLDGRVDFFTCNGHLEPDIAVAQAGHTYPQPAQFAKAFRRHRGQAPAAYRAQLLRARNGGPPA